MNMNKFQSDKEWLRRILPPIQREKKSKIPLKASPIHREIGYHSSKERWRATGHRWHDGTQTAHHGKLHQCPKKQGMR